MKLIEIFYLLVIFNVFMAVFAHIPMSNGQNLMTPSPGAESGFYGTDNPETGESIVTLADFILLMTALISSLIVLYTATTIVGNSRTPMASIYAFALVFQVVYVAAWFTFWNPLIELTPDSMSWITTTIGLLFTFIVESVYVLGFIQMTTGGWKTYM